MLGSSMAAHPTFHPVREDFPADGPVRKCPSFNDYVMSSFSVGIAYDMLFCVRKAADGTYWVEFDRSVTTLPEDTLAHSLNIIHAEYGIVQLALHPFWMFVSDDPDVHMLVLPAVGQTNPEPFRGQLNIYNWFRHTSYAFKVKVDEWVKISRNSPIFAVKFWHPTETHFVLGEIVKTDDIRRYERNMDLHNIIGSQTFSKWREIFKFNSKRRPAKVLQFIEDGK